MEFRAEVRVARPRQLLKGRTLALIGWMRRRGRLDLILVLPDGSRTLIPAAWTDLEIADVADGRGDAGFAAGPAGVAAAAGAAA